MRLYLIRHGQTAWNASGRAQGHIDEPLDAIGRAQADALADRLQDLPIRSIYSSDLQRAMDTAKPSSVRLGVPTTSEAALRERSFGEWEGLAFDELRQRMEAMAGPNSRHTLAVTPPGGESLMDVWNRLEPVFAMLMTLEAPAAVVTHGGTKALLLARLLHANPETSTAFRFGNASVTTLERRPDGFWRLESYGDMRHLERIGSIPGDLYGTAR